MQSFYLWCRCARICRSRQQTRNLMCRLRALLHLLRQQVPQPLLHHATATSTAHSHRDLGSANGKRNGCRDIYDFYDNQNPLHTLHQKRPHSKDPKTMFESVISCGSCFVITQTWPCEPLTRLRQISTSVSTTRKTHQVHHHHSPPD